MSDIKSVILERARHLMDNPSIGDPPVRKMLASEFAHLFPGRNESSIYQMICYYLRPQKNMTTDLRIGYSKRQMSQLVMMTVAEKRAYAERHGKTLRALDAAITRYKARQNENATSPFARDVALEHMQTRGYFDFSSATDLRALGLPATIIVAAKRALSHPWGLTLRAPNILYHPKSKKRYYMAMSEQTALLQNPSKFLKFRAEHIKAHWVDTATTDPVEDMDSEPETRTATPTKKLEGYPRREDGTIDLTVPRTRPGIVERLATKLIYALDNQVTPQPGTSLFTTLLTLRQKLNEKLDKK